MRNPPNSAVRPALRHTEQYGYVAVLGEDTVAAVKMESLEVETWLSLR